MVASIKQAHELAAKKHVWNERRGSESRKEIWFKVDRAQDEIDRLRKCLTEVLKEMGE